MEIGEGEITCVKESIGSSCPFIKCNLELFLTAPFILVFQRAFRSCLHCLFCEPGKKSYDVCFMLLICSCAHSECRGGPVLRTGGLVRVHCVSETTPDFCIHGSANMKTGVSDSR